MAQTITITGDDQVIAQLKRLGDLVYRLEPAMRDTSQFAERQIRGVPVRTGRLAASTRGGRDQFLDVDNFGFAVGTKVPYARMVFGGTKHMPARPPKVNARAIGRYAGDQILAELERA
jgi:hypothetical protein